jgi:hypothetical protein
MRRLLSPLAIVLLSAGASACGVATAVRSGGRPAAGPRNGGYGRTMFRDRDGDRDNRLETHYDNDDYFGPQAGAADARAIAALTRRYLRLAAAGSGAGACSLIYWVSVESLQEAYASPSAQRALRGKSCAQIMTVLFRRERSQLRFKAAHMKVEKIMVNGPLAWIVMSFGQESDSHFVLHREGGGWRMTTPQDAALR